MRARAQALTGGISASVLPPPEASTPPPPPPDHHRYSTPYMLSAETRGELSSDPPPTTYDASSVRVRLGPLRRGERARWTPVRAFTTPRRSEPSESSAPEPMVFTSSAGNSLSFHTSPIPWSQVDLTPPSRNKERRVSGKVRVSALSPVAGR